jgi:hypothetical protein
MRFRGAKNEKREWVEERVSVFVCFERERVFLGSKNVKWEWEEEKSTKFVCVWRCVCMSVKYTDKRERIRCGYI